MIIIMRFGENNLLGPKCIDIYEFCGVCWDIHIPPFFFLFIILKNRKSTRACPILKSNSTSFCFTFFFLRMNNKKNLKRGPRGPHSYFFTN